MGDKGVLFLIEDKMKHCGTVRIETERLILRRFTIDDAEEMFNNYASRDIVTEYLTWHTHKNVEETKQYLSTCVLPEYEKEDTYTWAIVLKRTNQVVGAIDVVSKNCDHRRAELGWVLSDDCWGVGLMPEAARKVLQFLFDVGFCRIQAKHDVNNPKSGRVMQKIGMTHEGTMKKYCPSRDDKNIYLDMDLWAITK